MSTLKALGIGLGLGAVLVSAVLAVALVSSSAPSRVSLLTVPGSKAAGVDGAIAVLAREGLQNHAKKLAVLHRQSAKFDGVNLDKVYKKAFNAAFMSAYRSTYKSALGKAEQNLWKQEETGKAAGAELRALERYKELSQLGHEEGKAFPLKHTQLRHCNEGNCAPLETRGVNVEPADSEAENPEPRAAWSMRRHCAEGNCKTLEEQGVNVDSVRGGEARQGRSARRNHGNQGAGTAWGGGTGNDLVKDPTSVRLERHGVNVAGGAFMDAIYKATPSLALDPSEFNLAEGRGRSPFISAEALRRRNGDQDGKLEGAGVAVNRTPMAMERSSRDHTMGTPDGINDRLVPAGEKAPAWRKSGHVATEEPNHFLLRDGGGESQWRDNGMGLEEQGPAATMAQGDLSRAGVNIGSW